MALLVSLLHCQSPRRNCSRQEKTILAAPREPFFLGENRFFLVTDKGVVSRGGEPGEPLGQQLDLSGDVPGWMGGRHHSDPAADQVALQAHPLVTQPPCRSRGRNGSHLSRFCAPPLMLASWIGAVWKIKITNSLLLKTAIEIVIFHELVNIGGIHPYTFIMIPVRSRPEAYSYPNMSYHISVKCDIYIYIYILYIHSQQTWQLWQTHRVWLSRTDFMAPGHIVVLPLSEAGGVRPRSKGCENEEGRDRRDMEKINRSFWRSGIFFWICDFWISPILSGFDFG